MCLTILSHPAVKIHPDVEIYSNGGKIPYPDKSHTKQDLDSKHSS